MLQPTETIWHNGKFIPWSEAKVHVLSHTLHYGGGAFEGIRFYNTDQGIAIFRLMEHVKRLFYSTKILKMDLPYSEHEIAEAMKAVAWKSNLESGYIRPIAFYGYGRMGVNPIGNPLELFIACWPWGAYLPYDSIDIKTSSYIRIHPDSTVVDAKLCGHYLNGILASLELQDTHYHEALFLDSQGYIAEGVGENFFIVKDNVIYTPKLGAILAGITRATIIELAQRLGFQVIEKNLSLDEVYQADEAFFTGTAAEVTAIGSINDKRLAQADKRKITSLLKAAYLDLVQGKNKEFLHYLAFCKPS